MDNQGKSQQSWASCHSCSETSSVEELFEKFIRDKRYLKNLSERTIDSYREVFGRWIRFVGREMPSEERLETFVVGMREADFDNHHLQHLHQIVQLIPILAPWQTGTQGRGSRSNRSPEGGGS